MRSASALVSNGTLPLPAARPSVARPLDWAWPVPTTALLPRTDDQRDPSEDDHREDSEDLVAAAHVALT